MMEQNNDGVLMGRGGTSDTGVGARDHQVTSDTGVGARDHQVDKPVANSMVFENIDGARIGQEKNLTRLQEGMSD